MFGAPPPATTLAIAPDHPVAHRIAAGSEPGLVAITRSPNPTTGRMRDQITVDDVRALNKFFGLSSTDGGHRVVIVDAADDMNIQAANALLKLLEEPPARTTLLLISHQPSALLPTIRSRCRSLRLSALSAQDMLAALEQAGAPDVARPEFLAELSAGSVGTALRLIALDGTALYSELIALLSSLPNLDRPRARAWADKAAARGAGDRFELMLTLTDIALARLARTGALGTPPPEAAPGEAQVLARLAPSPYAARRWADLAALLTQRSRHGKAVNLDPGALVLDTVFKMHDVSAALPA